MLESPWRKDYLGTTLVKSKAQFSLHLRIWVLAPAFCLFSFTFLSFTAYEFFGSALAGLVSSLPCVISISALEFQRMEQSGRFVVLPLTTSHYVLGQKPSKRVYRFFGGALLSFSFLFHIETLLTQAGYVIYRMYQSRPDEESEGEKLQWRFHELAYVCQ